MHTNKRHLQVFLAAAVALLLAVALVAVPATTARIQLLAKTLLVMGGNSNPGSSNLEPGLNHFFDPASPNYGFPGYNMVPVPWISDSFGPDPGYDASQNDGIENMGAAISHYLQGPDDEVIALGYSSSAQVIMHIMKQAEALGESAPSPDQLKFGVLASPFRPNGGVFARFPGLNWFGVPFEGATPDTGYDLVDVAYQYDPISDFPLYPIMPLSLLNSLFGWQYLHINYGGPESDISNAILDPKLTYLDEATGIRYVTIAPRHLPLLIPLYDLADAIPLLRPFMEPVLKLIEPTLKVLVDLGYNRDIPVGKNMRAQLIPLSLFNPIKIGIDLLKAFVKGGADAWASLWENITGKPWKPNGVQQTMTERTLEVAAAYTEDGDLPAPPAGAPSADPAGTPAVGPGDGKAVTAPPAVEGEAEQAPVEQVPPVDPAITDTPEEPVVPDPPVAEGFDEEVVGSETAPAATTPESAEPEGQQDPLDNDMGDKAVTDQPGDKPRTPEPEDTDQPNANRPSSNQVTTEVKGESRVAGSGPNPNAGEGANAA